MPEFSDQEAAFKRLLDAYPKAGASPAALVDAISTCDEPPAYRAPALAAAEVLTEDIVDALRLLRWARDSIDASERRLLDAARARNVSWRDIAEAMGLGSAQGAQGRRQRLGRPVLRRRA